MFNDPMFNDPLFNYRNPHLGCIGPFHPIQGGIVYGPMDNPIGMIGPAGRIDPLDMGPFSPFKLFKPFGP